MDSLMDCTFTFDGGPENPPTSGSFGPIYLEKRVYQNCQPEASIATSQMSCWELLIPS